MAKKSSCKIFNIFAKQLLLRVVHKEPLGRIFIHPCILILLIQRTLLKTEKSPYLLVGSSFCSDELYALDHMNTTHTTIKARIVTKHTWILFGFLRQIQRRKISIRGEERYSSVKHQEYNARLLNTCIMRPLP